MTTQIPIVMDQGVLTLLPPGDVLLVSGGLEAYGDFVTTIPQQSNFIVTTGSASVDGNSCVLIGGRWNKLTNSCLNGIILGGQSNLVDNCAESVVLGGNTNKVYQDRSIIAGGYLNTSNGYSSSVFGGLGNDVTGSYACNLGGKDNTVNSTRGVTVAGGTQNVSGYSSGSFSGWFTTVNGDYSAAVAGRSNIIEAGTVNSVTIGGSDSTITADDAVLVGGNNNTNNGDRSVVCGGVSHTVHTGCYNGFIGGGQGNTINNPQSSIIGGRYNETQNFYTTVLGGQYNTVSGKYGVSSGLYTLNPHWASHVQSGGIIGSAGDTQLIRCNSFGKSVSTTVMSLTLDGSAAGLEKLIQPADTVWYSNIILTGLKDDGASGIGVRIRACTRRDGTLQPVFVTGAGSTTNPTYVTDFEDVTGYNVAVAILAGSIIEVRVAGPAGYTVNWNCHWEITQIGVF